MDDNCKENVNVFKKITNYFETSKQEEEIPVTSYFRSHYSPATLINDWSEIRARQEPAIISSEPLLSETMDQFRKLCNMPPLDRQNASDATFRSYGLGQELLIDHLGTTFYNNYTTTNDLVFNHLAKGISIPSLRKYDKKRLPETDLTLVYGNLTQWGLKETVYEKSKLAFCKEQPPMSESSAEFVPYDLSAVKKLNDFPSFKKVKQIF